MKQFLIILGMIVAVNAWSKDLYICDVVRFHGGGAEVTPGVEYKELHTFILKKGFPGEIRFQTIIGKKQRLQLSDRAKIEISKNALEINFYDDQEDIFGKLNFYEDNKYFGKIVVHADFSFSVQCLKQPVKNSSIY